VPSRLATGLSVALCAAALGGCRDTPPAPPKTLALALAVDPRAEGDAAAARKDWPTAVARYGEAVRSASDDVMLRFALASALSHLDRTADAAEHFAWVVQHGDPSQPEVASARQWLRGIGALPGTATVAQTTSTVSADATVAQATGTGGLSGSTSWPGVERHTPLRIRLRGQTDATKDARDRVTIPLGKPFTFPKVKAGEYRLVGEASGVALWDVPVTVEADKTTTLELSPANSSVPAAGFPPRG
jgi:hypothetical protein